MGKKLNFKPTILTDDSYWYISQPTKGNPRLVEQTSSKKVSKASLKNLSVQVLLKGTAGAVILGPGAALQIYGEPGIDQDVITLYSLYLEQGVRVFKKPLGGSILEVIVAPSIQEAIEENDLIFSSLLQGYVPTPLYGIEYNGKYLLDLNSLIKRLQQKKKERLQTSWTTDTASSTSSTPKVEVLTDNDSSSSEKHQEENEDWMALDLSARQREKLAELGIQVDPTWNRGQASRIIQDRLNNSTPATDRQVKLLRSLGIPIKEGLQRAEASQQIKDARKKKGLV